DDALLARAIEAARLDAVQLHGAESPARAAAVRDRFGVEVWKAVPVKASADLALARRYAGAAQRILYDAKTPASADLPGGMGLRFDCRLLADARHPLPWALSGGLEAGNAGDAVAITGARLLDVSSGVERAPGVKDVDKIAGFLQSIAQL
ncbi:MAG: phosphoribosylanthranilate isomerase, partial [Sphingomonas sp.]